MDGERRNEANMVYCNVMDLDGDGLHWKLSENCKLAVFTCAFAYLDSTM
jgi:hypothetical protein